MPMQSQEKFATQVKAETLRSLRCLAQQEGSPLEDLVEEAIEDLLEKRKQNSPRASVMAAYQSSHEKFASLYKKLAE